MCVLFFPGSQNKSEERGPISESHTIQLFEGREYNLSCESLLKILDRKDAPTHERAECKQTADDNFMSIFPIWNL